MHTCAMCGDDFVGDDGFGVHKQWICWECIELVLSMAATLRERFPGRVPSEHRVPR